MYRVPKKQFKLWIEEDQLDRLSEIADRFGRGSAQQVVEEVLALYLPVWVTVNTAVNRAVHAQTLEEHPKISGQSIAAEAEHPIPMPGLRKRKVG